MLLAQSTHAALKQPGYVLPPSPPQPGVGSASCLGLGLRKGKNVTVERNWCFYCNSRMDSEDLGRGGNILEKDRHIGFKSVWIWASLTAQFTEGRICPYSGSSWAGNGLPWREYYRVRSLMSLRTWRHYYNTNNIWAVQSETVQSSIDSPLSI